MLCVLAFVPLWIAQMITRLVPCANHCARVLFIRGTLLGFNPVFCIVFVWSLSLCFYTARRNLGGIKNITHSSACLPNHSYQRDEFPEFTEPIYGFHMTGNTDMHLLVTDTLKKGRGMDQKTSQYLV